MKPTYALLVAIEAVLFLAGWTLVFLWGADFPPPEGFWKVIALGVALDVAQTPYLLMLLSRVRERPTFARNLLFFAAGGILVALVTSAGFTGRTFGQIATWTLAILCASVLYGLLAWGLNWAAKGFVRA